MGNARFIARSANVAALVTPSFFLNLPSCIVTNDSTTGLGVITRNTGNPLDQYGIRVGDAVNGTGITSGTLVLYVNASSIGLDQPATIGNGVNLRFGNLKSPRVINGNSLYTSTPSDAIIADGSNIQNIVDPDRYGAVD